MIYDFLWFVVALAVLTVGADALVRGATGLALALRVPPMVVALTIVATGTSLPEITVSVLAGWQGNAGIAIGNVLGSNIANVLVILGLSLLVRPIRIQSTLVARELPMLGALQVALLFMLVDGEVGRVDGVALVLAGLMATAVIVRGARGEGDGEAPPAHWVRDLALVGGGLVALVFGGDWLVTAATSMARVIGLTERVIGLTIVAVGTSMPELATSVVAARKAQDDVVVGNVIGSNLVNLWAALGIAAAFAPIGGLGTGTVVDALLALIVILPMVVFAAARRPAPRILGVVLLASYAGYVAWLLQAG